MISISGKKMVLSTVILTSYPGWVSEFGFLASVTLPTKHKAAVLCREGNREGLLVGLPVRV